jgi:hypothetical protein
VQRFLPVAVVVVAAIVVWLTVFFGTAWVIVALIETFEGDTSECWSSKCGRFGEFIDDHDLLGTVLLAVFAALPTSFLVWKARHRFAKPS